MTQEEADSVNALLASIRQLGAAATLSDIMRAMNAIDSTSKQVTLVMQKTVITP